MLDALLDKLHVMSDPHQRGVEPQGAACRFRNGPFIYPFVRGRTGANTRIVDLRRGQSIPDDANREFDFVLTYGGEFPQTGFASLYKSNDIALYENTVRKD